MAAGPLWLAVVCDSDVAQNELDFVFRVLQNVLGRILRRPSDLPSAISLQRASTTTGQLFSSNSKRDVWETYDPAISTGTNSLGQPSAFAAASMDSSLGL